MSDYLDKDLDDEQTCLLDEEVAKVSAPPRGAIESYLPAYTAGSQPDLQVSSVCRDIWPSAFARATRQARVCRHSGPRCTVHEVCVRVRVRTCARS